MTISRAPERVSVRFAKVARRLIATGLGTGLAPWAPGTFGTLAGLPLAFALGRLSVAEHALAVLIFFAIGLPVCGGVARELGQHDPQSIVWDEIVGVQIALFGSPLALWPFFFGFALFRLFDILKPFPLRRLERLPGGLGIMADDVGAGIYTALILWGVRSWLATSLGL
ncbi:MAG: phosphatidylglycerophosphatase A family protein [Acidiferrobacteraceae bacterium]